MITQKAKVERPRASVNSILDLFSFLVWSCRIKVLSKYFSTFGNLSDFDFEGESLAN